MATARKPQNCLWPKEAAAELRTNSSALHKKMRIIGWLHIDRKSDKNGDTKGPKHNLPTSDAIKNGYLIAVESSYQLKGEVPITKYQTKPAITQKGFEFLQGVIKRGEAPPPTPSATITPIATPEPQKKIATRERAHQALKTILTTILN